MQTLSFQFSICMVFFIASCDEDLGALYQPMFDFSGSLIKLSKPGAITSNGPAGGLVVDWSANEIS